MSDKRKRHAVPPRTVELLAIAAGKDPRTVRRVLAGKTVKPCNQKAIEGALAALGQGELTSNLVLPKGGE